MPYTRLLHVSLLLIAQLLIVATRSLTDVGQDHRAMLDGRLSASIEQETCLQDPTQATCASYKYPAANAYADLDSLCTGMPFMPSCSVYKTCNKTQGQASQNFDLCQPLNLLATVCALDPEMSRMTGCLNYNKLCTTSGTAIRDCKELWGITFLPTTDAVNLLVKDICDEMDMDGCEKCTPSWQAGKKYGDCDLVGVYSELCYQMPGMWECGPYSRMCTADKSLYLCGDEETPGFKPGPAMLMYFNSKMPFYLLFKEWTPHTTAQYVASWIAIFILAIVYEALVTARNRLEVYWKNRTPEYTSLDNEATEKMKCGMHSSVWVRIVESIVRAAFTFVTVAVSYMCMLAAMSFNVGIFLAVCAGFAAGELLLGRLRKGSEGIRNDQCCSGGTLPL